MTFFCSVQFIFGAMGMAMTITPMTVPMLVEEEKSKDVGKETETPDYQDKPGVGDYLWFNESLDSLQED